MVFDGKKLADEILGSLKKETKAWLVKPRVIAISLGAEKDNSAYILQKKKAADFLGFDFKHKHYSEAGSQKLRFELNKLAKSEKNSAIIIQLPLPESVSPAIVNVVPVDKDPDLLSDSAVGLFFNGRSLVEPPTPAAILKILEVSNTELKNKNVVVFGYGRLVGRFLVPMLIKRGASVSVIEKEIPQELVLELSSKADIIISASGSPKSISAAMVKNGAVVIDSGFSVLDPALARKSGVDGNIVGDVDFESVKNKASLITPVPGGVGPVGVAMLFSNIVSLYKQK